MAPDYTAQYKAARAAYRLVCVTSMDVDALPASMVEPLPFEAWDVLLDLDRAGFAAWRITRKAAVQARIACGLGGDLTTSVIRRYYPD